MRSALGVSRIFMSIKVNKRIYNKLYDLLKEHCSIPELCIESLIEFLITFYIYAIEYMEGSEQNKEDVLMALLRIADEKYKDGIPIKLVRLWGKYLLLSEKEIKKIIKKNKMAGLIYIPKKGRIKIL